jgi:ATP-dependent Clp protease ATP-binding subunit ClpC
MQLGFNDDVRSSTAAARVSAARLGAAKIEPRHLLLGVLRGGESGAERVLSACGTDVETLRRQVGGELASDQAELARADIPYTAAAQRTMMFSMDEACQLASTHVGSEHMLLGILRVGGPAADVLLGAGLTLDRLRRQISHASRE